MLHNTPRWAVATLAFTLLGSSSAFAVDAGAFGERLKSVLSAQGLSLTYASADEAGSDVVLRAMKVGAPGEAGTDIGDVTFAGVTGSTEEGWKIASIPIKDIEKTEGATKVSVTNIAVEEIEIVGTAGDAASKAASEIFFKHAAVGNVTVTEDGKPGLTVDGSEVTNTVGENGAISSEFNLGDFNADFSVGKPNETQAVMREIGYEKLSGSASGMAAWDPTSGELKLEPFTIAAEDAGELNFSYSITGYTPSFIQSLKQLQQQMTANPQNSQASGMAVMGLISQLYLKSAELSFADDSLTGKLLDYYAKKNGQSREQLTQNLTAMLPAVLGYLQNPEFQKEVTDAVTAYLADPQSLTISIAPQNPVPAAQLIGAAMGAPQTLPAVLSLSVTSNDAEADEDDGGDAN
ncbi:hypothetical protein [Mangrovicella endophytica]|uniref:hypothetical protein n=1 Tax=Mangrovicella endophytica TaxID=2066697 RepID=UPI000C9E5436|nr:hypothetical protein [Mangrovicella endophytica]